MPTISVIIPTTCDAKREKLLRRAISSTLGREGVSVQLVVVVNGSRVDEGVLQSLPGFASIIRLDEGNVSKARFEGLKASTGDYFCFLDDDDEFLPGALAHRLSLFSDPYVDCVVTNGYVNDDTRLVPELVAKLANKDPAAAFLLQNWFASPGSMFKRGAVGYELFDMEHRYFEWTLLFFKMIAARHQIKYDDTPTYRVWQNSPESASGSHEHRIAFAGVLGEILKLPLDDKLLPELRRKHQNALNFKSQMHLERRQRLEAWRSHLSCLSAGGWRYLPFTRKLLF